MVSAQQPYIPRSGKLPAPRWRPPSGNRTPKPTCAGIEPLLMGGAAPLVGSLYFCPSCYEEAKAKIDSISPAGETE